jgi:TonB family protein
MGSDSLASLLAPGLLQATLALTLGLALVHALRLPLRRAFGARIAYAAWWLAPACLVAPLLPLPAQAPRVFDAAQGALAAAPALVVSALPAAGAGLDWRAALVAAWALGAIAMLVLLARRQHGFERRIERRPGQPWDQVRGHGPAVAGLLHPRVLLPEDFGERYTPQEQALVLAHERLHVMRGDVAAQAAASALRCVFWFHPLVHVAASAFRFDQELACDADVLARFPGSRRAYGDAMLKTQLADAGLPIGCHWQSSHPLKERLTMLKQPIPGALRRTSGRVLVGLALAGGAYAAWAAQPAQQAMTAAKATIDVQFRISVDGAPALTPRVVVREGETFLIDLDKPAVRVTATARRVAGKKIALRGELSRDGKSLGPIDMELPDGSVPDAATTLPPDVRAGVVLQAGARVLGPGEAATPVTELHDRAPYLAKVTERDVMTPPKYPKAALAQQLHGTVMIELYVDREGAVGDVRVVSADPPGVFEDAAITAAKQWHFSADARDAEGKRPSGWLRTQIDFRPDGPPAG